MTTTLILIPVIIAVTGFLVLKSVQLGLRWQLQTKQEQPPTLDSPLQPIIDKVEQKQQAKQAEVSESVFNEWVNGVEESR
jgi:hypothetical protein